MLADLRQRQDEERALHEWGPTVCQRLLAKSELVLFHLTPAVEGAKEVKLLCSVHVHDVNFLQVGTQEVYAHVLAASPCPDVSDLVAGDVRDSALPRVRLLCGNSESDATGQVASCLHLHGHLAQVYWDQMRRETWSANLRDWHEVVVSRAQLRAAAPQMSLATLDEAIPSKPSVSKKSNEAEIARFPPSRRETGMLHF